MHKRRILKTVLALLSLVVLTRQAAAQEDLPQLIEKIRRAVVTVIIYDGADRVRGMGSGFFINEAGHLITNFHVLAQASRAEVKTHDGRVYPVKMALAEDPQADLIRVVADLPPGESCPFLQISNQRARVGERVLVVGSPLGLDQTVTDGMVSGLRNIPRMGELLQISAPISPGSSGGPVVNLQGEVLGVAKGFLARGQNLNFAIPGFRVLALKEGPPRPLTGRPDSSLPARPGGLPPRPQINLPARPPQP